MDTYSRGMLQRLGLADALVKQPLVLILDEPTTSIDPVGVVEVLELVRSLAHDQGVAVLLSSHLLHQVQQICDRMAIFVAGDVVAMGTVAELAARQEHGVLISIEVGADGDPRRRRYRPASDPGRRERGARHQRPSALARHRRSRGADADRSRASCDRGTSRGCSVTAGWSSTTSTVAISSAPTDLRASVGPVRDGEEAA